MKIAPKNWKEFQHYKDRDPTWIKLHKKLLDNFEFHRLPLASRALAPMLWLIASEHQDGIFDADPERIAFRLRTNKKDVEAALSPLIDSFFEVAEQDASSPLANAERDASPETYKAEDINKRQTRVARALTIETLVSDGLTEKTAAEFLALRKKKRAALTETAWDGIKAEAEKVGWPIEQAVRKALARGWQSFDAEWVKREHTEKPSLPRWT